MRSLLALYQILSSRCPSFVLRALVYSRRHVSGYTVVVRSQHLSALYESSTVQYNTVQYPSCLFFFFLFVGFVSFLFFHAVVGAWKMFL